MSWMDLIRRIPAGSAKRERGPNRPRFNPQQNAGHVESYFLRANHPDKRLAVWLKATILAPGRKVAAATADVWCIVFDGEANPGRVWAHRETVPIDDARLTSRSGGGLEIELAGCYFELGDSGLATGALQRGAERCRWRLRWSQAGTRNGGLLSIFPYRFMVEGPFPKSKLLTPSPSLVFRGSIECFGETLDVDGWHGMQGHNWGTEHAWEYAWGQCAFPETQKSYACVVEGFTSRIRLAGKLSPPLSAMVVRRGGREYRFDQVFHLWKQDAEIGDMSWSLRLQGPGGTAHLLMVADPELMVCLGYKNPDGRMSYCMNSKLARVRLRVCPRGQGEPSFEVLSEHGGALEILRPEPDSRFPDVV